MHIVIVLLVIFAAWRWGDWSRFRQFHATMLYIATMNLLYFYFTSDKPLWVFQSTIGIPEHVLDVLHAFIVLPCTVMIFLSNFPKALTGKILLILKWVLIYVVLEYIGYHIGAIDYHNGWSIGWSILFVTVMFPMLRLHYTRPVTAYAFSVIIIAILLILFEVPWIH